jgi:hypothetical protein
MMNPNVLWVQEWRLCLIDRKNPKILLVMTRDGVEAVLK